MQIPPEIAFRNVSRTPAIDQTIEAGIAELEQLQPRITSCRVMVELPHRRHRQGNLYRVRVDVTLPGAEIVVSRHPPADNTNEDVVVAIAEAFDTARTQLLEHGRKRRAELKPAEPPPRGRILRIFPGEGYGFLESLDGREIYFHENAVQGRGFDALVEGQDVRFSEELGDKGPQAIAVIPGEAGEGGEAGSEQATGEWIGSGGA
jgi:cold shock CspA family protein/ribosome-associated translation inhibitor RaiA